VKNFPYALAQHLAGGQTTLCLCLLIQRADGVFIGLTELDQDVSMGGVLFIANAGFSRFNLQDKNNLESASIKLEGAINTVITRDDLAFRRYDYAQVQIFLVNYVTGDFGIVFTGFTGTASVKEYSFELELRSLSYRTTRMGGELCTPTCRVDLGSARCGINVGAMGITGTVTNAGDGFKNFTGSAAQGAQPLAPGVIQWITGNNAGTTSQVVTFAGGSVGLFLETPDQIQAGDIFIISPACDKTRDTCKNVFNNLINFQGEPDVPGPDHLLDYPDWHPPHR
jgi:uncharacterized phage protein (TIGR02218 family)